MFHDGMPLFVFVRVLEWFEGVVSNEFCDVVMKGVGDAHNFIS